MYTLIFYKDSKTIVTAKSINHLNKLYDNEIEITEQQYNQMNEFPLRLTFENGKVASWEKIELEPEPIKPIQITATQAVENFMTMQFKATMPSLTKTEILKCEPLVEEWKKGKFVIGDIRRHLGQVWECCQGHDNANNPDIEPGQSPAQWFPYHSKEKEYAKPFVQPQGAHDIYKVGEYMIFTDGLTYISTMETNSWSPVTYPQGWEVV